MFQRYNPKNLVMFEQYVDRQCAENMYDLEANLAVLKLYQFNPSEYNPAITQRILLKAITNLPHTDIILCKCLLAPENMEEPEVQDILRLSTLLELCQFQAFWEIIVEQPSIIAGMTGFEDSIRRYACHVLNITYQRISKELVRSTLNVTASELNSWISKYGWTDEGSTVFIRTQDESVKTKNIREKVDFETVAGLMAASK
ncbi:eukaryotic translation initiation factor 3 subunit K-like isoform X2 [Pollicipes pollicipes]|uniref:eukaryotic translation initiation factor 3 subunit K-like isoform X2 n=1 Tax=Pollicipes pollicipes TaxID=41117 RepID=UPI00188586C2|nr:eukaryotic translation initiation factor 3 subunit K-like isoform X2 [Pollicipes pollicipes]